MITKNILICLIAMPCLVMAMDQSSIEPMQIDKAQNAIKLDLSSKQLTKLPAGLVELSNVIALNVANNNLTSKAISKLWKICPRLEELNLSFNQLTSLPVGLGVIKQSLNNINFDDPDVNMLRQMTIYYRGSGFCDGLANLIYLKKLNVSGNYLDFESIARICESCLDLEELDLSHSELFMLPTSVKFLVRLRTLNLQGNRITPENQEFIRQLIAKSAPQATVLF